MSDAPRAVRSTRDFRNHVTLGKRPPMKTMAITELRRQLAYNPDTGIFRWRVSNYRRRAGQEAGYYCRNLNSIHIGVGGKVFAAHRLAWAHYYGEWPTVLVDHVDGDRRNNRISNLRLATPSENSRNSSLYKNNKTGFRGVSDIGRGKRRYVATICVERRIVYLGGFETPEEAHAAYVAAAIRLHGEYASDGTSRYRVVKHSKKASQTHGKEGED